MRERKNSFFHVFPFLALRKKYSKTTTTKTMPNGVRFLSNIAKVSPLSDTPVKSTKQNEQKNGKRYGKNARIRFKTEPSKEIRASFGVACVTYDGNCFLTVTGHSGLSRVGLIAKYFNEEFMHIQKVYDCLDDEDPMTQLQLRQEHAGWLHGASERSDIAKGLVPVYDIPALPEA